MLTIKLNGGTLTLPPEAMLQIGPNDEVTVVASGDTIILKKVRTLTLSDIATRASDDKQMSMEEVSEEVHRYRRNRNARRH